MRRNRSGIRVILPLILGGLLVGCDTQGPDYTLPDDLKAYPFAVQNGDDVVITFGNGADPGISTSAFNQLSNKLANDYQVKSYLQLIADKWVLFQKNRTIYQQNKQFNALENILNTTNSLQASTTISIDELEDLNKDMGLDKMWDMVENSNHSIRKKGEAILKKYPELKNLSAPLLSAVLAKAGDKINVQEPPIFYPDPNDPGGGLFGATRQGGAEAAGTCDIELLHDYNACVYIEFERYMGSMAVTLGSEFLLWMICVSTTAATGIGPVACSAAMIGVSLITVAHHTFSYMKDIEQCDLGYKHGCDCKTGTMAGIKKILMGVGCEVDDYHQSTASSALGIALDIVPPNYKPLLPDVGGAPQQVIVFDAATPDGEVTVEPLIHGGNCKAFFSNATCDLLNH